MGITYGNIFPYENKYFAQQINILEATNNKDRYDNTMDQDMKYL